MNKKAKKIVSSLLIAVLILGACALYLGVESKTLDENRTLSGLFGREMYLTAHRGFSAVAPENTAPALEEAGKAGFYAAEFDIMPTADGVWILNHNDTVDKMTDGEGEVALMTFAEIQKLRIDNGNGIENYPDLQVTTFEEALEICVKYDMRAMVEVKGGTADDMQSMLDVLTASEAYETALVIDFDKDRIAAVRALDADIELWYLMNELNDEKIAFVKEQNMGIAFNFGIAKNYKYLKSAREQGITLATWTVDFPPCVDFVRLFGVKYITTNKIHP